MPKLERSLRAAAKNFGDTTRQGVVRLAVQTARENAVSSQAFGRSGTRKIQEAAIEAGMRAVVVPLEKPRVRGGTVSGTWNGKPARWPIRRYLSNVGDINDWVDQRRTRRRGQTPRGVPASELGAAPASVWKKALKARKTRSGIAKGGWLGAGMRAANFQRGGHRITIGKNFLGYAQKHSHFGRARQSGSVFTPTVTLRNRSHHSGSPYVLSSSEIQKNVNFAARKTLAWYRKAAKGALDRA